MAKMVAIIHTHEKKLCVLKYVEKCNPSALMINIVDCHTFFYMNLLPLPFVTISGST